MDQEAVAEIKRHVELVADGLRSEIRLVDEKAERRSEELERRLRSEMQSGMQDFRTEMQSGMQDFRTEMNSGMQDLRTEMNSGMKDLRTEMNTGMQDLRRHFDVVAESLRSDIHLVAEGVAGLDEKFTLEFVKVREEIAEQIGDVKSLLRASYGDLDRRVRRSKKKPS